MSDPERRPEPQICAAGAPRSGQGSRVEVLAPREVPLGGPRALPVRRTLPQRQRTLIGAWCFLDHYGPVRIDEADSGAGAEIDSAVVAIPGMAVPPHPHTGLATVSWLFSGLIEHRDSAGHHAWVRPGELNLMTAGAGISHSEHSRVEPGATGVLHGVQLWLALPEQARFDAPCFVHFAPEPARGAGWTVRVFLGDLPDPAAPASPVATPAPVLGAEIVLEPGASWTLGLRSDFEHGILVDTGALVLNGEMLAKAYLGYLPTGRGSVSLQAGPEGARLLLLGGPPFGEQIVMWWNFVGRAHDEIAAFRAAWQAEIGAERDGERGSGRPGPRYGLPRGDPDPPLPAPELPKARITPRG